MSEVPNPNSWEMLEMMGRGKELELEYVALGKGKMNSLHGHFVVNWLVPLAVEQPNHDAVLWQAGWTVRWVQVLQTGGGSLGPTANTLVTTKLLARYRSGGDCRLGLSLAPNSL